MIRMERGENRLNKEFVQAMNQALDAAERYVEVCVQGRGKHTNDDEAMGVNNKLHMHKHSMHGIVWC